jgi:hypothetical protein
MCGASWILDPADYQVLSTAGEQHHLPLTALDEMDSAARVQGNGFSQDQYSPGSGLRPPATKLEKSGHRADQRDHADQNTNNEQYGLRRHPNLWRAGAAIRVPGGYGKAIRSGRISGLLAIGSRANGFSSAMPVVRE